MTTFPLNGEEIQLKNDLNELDLTDFLVMGALDPTDETDFILGIIAQLSGKTFDEVSEMEIEQFRTLREEIISMFEKIDDSPLPEVVKIGDKEFIVKAPGKLSMREVSFIKQSTVANGVVGSIPDILSVLVVPFTEQPNEEGVMVKTPIKFSPDLIDARKEFFKKEIKYPLIKKIVGFFGNGNLS